MTTSKTPLDGPRRQLIIDATLQSIVDHGVAALSHRRIAKQAGVTLSATSYYFGTIDDLIEEAFSQTVARDLRDLRAELEPLAAGADLVETIANVVHERVTARSAAILTSELMVAALRSDRLRKLAHEWGTSWKEMMLSPHLDDATAETVMALTSGLIQRSLMSEAPLTVEEIAGVLKPVVTSALPAA